MRNKNRIEKIRVKLTINISIEIKKHIEYNREDTMDTYNDRIDINKKNKDIIGNILLKHSINIYIEI
jgi:hypothetical protein